MKKQKKFRKKTIVLVVIIIAALLDTVAGTITAYAYTDGFKTMSPTAIYYADNIYTSEANINLPRQGDARFIVGGTGFSDDKKVIRVTIKPNPNTNFYYTVDGKAKSYERAGELTQFFDIEYEKNAFIIHNSGNQYYILKVLSLLHDGGEVTPTSNLKPDYFYDIEITVDGSTILLHAKQLLYKSVQELPGLDDEYIF